MGECDIVTTGTPSIFELGELLTYVNGEFVPAREAVISVFDRSFVYGDGVFEGLSVDEGHIFGLDSHIARFLRSAHALSIGCPITDVELRRAILHIAAVNDLRDGYIRPILTRGTGPLGLNSTRGLRPNLVIVPQVRSRLNEEQRLGAGLSATTVAVRRIPPECLDPRVKSNNYLNQILAKLQQWDSGADMGILLDTSGLVSECCGENIFVVSNDVLYTPPEQGVLAGITRATVMDLYRQRGGVAIEKPLTLYDLYTGDEVFVTATLIEIAGLTCIDGRVIAAGTVGPITRQLGRRLRDTIVTEGVPVPYGN